MCIMFYVVNLSGQTEGDIGYDYADEEYDDEEFGESWFTQLS